MGLTWVTNECESRTNMSLSQILLRTLHGLIVVCSNTPMCGDSAPFSTSLRCVAVCRSVLQSFAVLCSVLQRVAVCCSVLQCVNECLWTRRSQGALQCVGVCWSVLQLVAACCSVLQCVAVCCRMREDSAPFSTSSRIKWVMPHIKWVVSHITSALSHVNESCPWQVRGLVLPYVDTCRCWRVNLYAYVAYQMSIAVCCSVLQCVAVCCSVLRP